MSIGPSKLTMPRKGLNDDNRNSALLSSTYCIASSHDLFLQSFRRSHIIGENHRASELGKCCIKWIRANLVKTALGNSSCQFHASSSRTCISYFVRCWKSSGLSGRNETTTPQTSQHHLPLRGRVGSHFTNPWSSLLSSLTLNESGERIRRTELALVRGCLDYIKWSDSTHPRVSTLTNFCGNSATIEERFMTR